MVPATGDLTPPVDPITIWGADALPPKKFENFVRFEAVTTNPPVAEQSARAMTAGLDLACMGRSTMTPRIPTAPLVACALLMSATLHAQTRDSRSPSETRAPSTSVAPTRGALADASAALSEARVMLELSQQVREGRSSVAGCAVSDTTMADELRAVSVNLEAVQRRLGSLSRSMTANRQGYITALRSGIMRAQRAINRHLNRRGANDFSLPPVTCTCYSSGVAYSTQSCVNCSTSEQSAFIDLCIETSGILGAEGAGYCLVTYGLPSTP